jgi:hypothetical protein
VIDHILMLTGTTHGFPQIQTCLETYLPPSRHKKDFTSPWIPCLRLGSRDFDAQGTEPADFDTIPLNQTLTEQPEYGVLDLAGEGRFAVILLAIARARSFLVIVAKTIWGSQGGWDSRESQYMPKDLSNWRAHRGFGAISDAERM